MDTAEQLDEKNMSVVFMVQDYIWQAYFLRQSNLEVYRKLEKRAEIVGNWTEMTLTEEELYNFTKRYVFEEGTHFTMTDDIWINNTLGTHG